MADWCALDSRCNYSIAADIIRTYNLDDFDTDINYTNESNSSCWLPFCVKVLSFTIHHSNVRYYDLVLLVLSVLFLVYLLLQLVATIKKLHGSVTLFRLLYFMVFLIPVVSCIYEALAVSAGYRHIIAKIVHVFLRGVILMTEISVVTFGLFFKYYGRKEWKLVVTVIVMIGVTIVFVIVEGVLEFFNPHVHKLPCEVFGFFTHGGMVFLFTTSTLFAVAYLLTFILYMFGCHRRIDLPSKKSFYRYALFLSLVNIAQAVGSLLWFISSKHPNLGNAGICLTLVTNVIYVGTFAPVVYWIFLSNYFRMNKDLKEAAELEKSEINVSSKDKRSIFFKFTRSSSNPLYIGRRSHYADQTSLTAGSYASSSSYGSLNGEDTFMDRRTPDFKGH